MARALWKGSIAFGLVSIPVELHTAVRDHRRVDSKFPAAKDLRKPELEMAKTLVENLADRWNPEQYTDQYRENLMRIIRARVKGKAPKLVEDVEPQQAEVIDLMERLRRSLEASGGAARTRARAKKTPTRAKRKRAA